MIFHQRISVEGTTKSLEVWKQWLLVQKLIPVGLGMENKVEELDWSQYASRALSTFGALLIVRRP